jgi:beta-glucosidase
MATADLPPFEDYSMRGRTYRFAEKEPLYPFGFGLNYAELSYGNLAAEMKPDGQVVARTTISNHSARDTIETVQCYVTPPNDWPDAPKASLVGFRKVTVPAGETVNLTFQLSAEQLYQYDQYGCHVPVPGDHTLTISSASPGGRAQALGAPTPASGVVTVV